MATDARGIARRARTARDLGPVTDTGGDQAPVCHQPATSDIPQPAGSNMPSIPGTDGSLDSLTNAVNALTQGYNQLAGFGPSASGNGGGGGGGSSGFKLNKQNQQQQNSGARFVELSRNTQKVHVTNPDDDTQFVDVEVITSLTLQDTKTSEQWIWKR